MSLYTQTYEDFINHIIELHNTLWSRSSCITRWSWAPMICTALTKGISIGLEGNQLVSSDFKLGLYGILRSSYFIYDNVYLCKSFQSSSTVNKFYVSITYSVPFFFCQQSSRLESCTTLYFKIQVLFKWAIFFYLYMPHLQCILNCSMLI